MLYLNSGDANESFICAFDVPDTKREKQYRGQSDDTKRRNNLCNQGVTFCSGYEALFEGIPADAKVGSGEHRIPAREYLGQILCEMIVEWAIDVPELDAEQFLEDIALADIEGYCRDAAYIGDFAIESIIPRKKINAQRASDLLALIGCMTDKKEYN